MSFERLKVKPNLVKALQELGIVKPTHIQEQAIPLIQAGKDVIGISKTGSGKTAAFGVPILEKLERGLQALIVVPTRELACQISDELRKFSKYQPCRVAAVYGGVSIRPQVEDIRRANIVVGTPGRLVDHLRQHSLILSNIRFVVLDEADKMVEMGFIQDIRAIMQHTPKQKQVMLFGATISDEVDQLKRLYMKDAVVARSQSQLSHEFLAQYYYNVELHEKFSLLVHLLKKEQTKQAIIFCSKRSTVDLLTLNLRRQGIKAEKIHGKLNQGTRLSVIDSFRKGFIKVLVASAVAARGLDFRNVTHIFNYDLPRDPQEYIHRVGRTARAGDSGKAITLLSPNNHDEFSSILSRYRVNVEALPNERFPRLQFDPGRHRTTSHFDRRNVEQRRHSWQPRGYGA
jgi:ATP-dependent RNA helicase DeaD